LVISHRRCNHFECISDIDCEDYDQNSLSTLQSPHCEL
jgi:hypothetical protein